MTAQYLGVRGASVRVVESRALAPGRWAVMFMPGERAELPEFQSLAGALAYLIAHPGEAELHLPPGGAREVAALFAALCGGAAWSQVPEAGEEARRMEARAVEQAEQALGAMDPAVRRAFLRGDWL